MAAEVSIARLFAAGIGPGLLLIVLFAGERLLLRLAGIPVDTIPTPTTWS